MSAIDIGTNEAGDDIDFANDDWVKGLPEYRGAVLLRLSHEFTYERNANGSPVPFGIDLAAELGTVGGDASLGVRASAAIQNDERFTAQLIDQKRPEADGAIEIELSFEITVDETGETFSLDVLLADGKVSLVP